MLKVAGVHVGVPGPVGVYFEDKHVGKVVRDAEVFAVRMPEQPKREWRASVQLETGDEGTWFVVESLDLILKRSTGTLLRVARWTPEQRVTAQRERSGFEYHLDWMQPEELKSSTAALRARDTKLGGRWKGTYGSLGAWIPKRIHEKEQNGFLVTSTGTEFTWSGGVDDRRVLQSLEDTPSAPPATCWFAADSFLLTVTPPDLAPYLLTLYVVDYDRNGRASEVSVEDSLGQVLDTRNIPEKESAEGVYLTWEAAGPTYLKLRKTAGFNVVASGIFVDRVPQ
jgi:hypothetical protein